MPASTSVAAPLTTAVAIAVFSATSARAPAAWVIVGASLTLVIAIVKACVSLFVPSLATTLNA